jgi:3-dehydroquinate synthase
MDVTRVNLGPRSYDVAVVSDADSEFGQFARQRAADSRTALVVTDSNLESHAAGIAVLLGDAGFDVELACVPAGEESKSLEQAAFLFDRLADFNADRRTLVVAAGGGVVGDLAGFAAATYNRGLPLLMVPTSLLAMVDSSVGGKVGINLAKGKNLVGAFHQPVGVWIDTKRLETLPEREFRGGLAEVVKYGVIRDAELFSWLEQDADRVLANDPAAIRHVIARCCRIKADVVEQDEREETGVRIILNYGHTFAHAFETIAGYGVWLHGEAVAAGMICASRLAERLRLIPVELTARQVQLLERFGLPTAPNPWPVDDLIAIMRRDKKARSGRLRFVLPRRLGEVAVVDDVPERDVAAILSQQPD